MTRIEVSADTVEALGAALARVADDLAWQAVRSSEQTDKGTRTGCADGALTGVASPRPR